MCLNEFMMTWSPDGSSDCFSCSQVFMTGDFLCGHMALILQVVPESYPSLEYKLYGCPRY